VDAEAWDERYAASELVWSREPNQFVAAELADLPPGTAVDLAAGEGRNAIWLASRGWSATAVDFSQVALDKGARLAAQAGIDVTWVCADATAWQPPEPVDLVVVAYLQLPAEDRRRAVRGAGRMLAPGGTLLLVAHDSTNLTSRSSARSGSPARSGPPTSTAARSGVRPGTAWYACGRPLVEEVAQRPSRNRCQDCFSELLSEPFSDRSTGSSP
jgi:SAM-dependent methyltransferase